MFATLLSLPLLILTSLPHTLSTTALSAPTGDTLNRTACYCASPRWIIDQTYGYYYNLSYYNAHLDRTFSLSPSCTSSLAINVQDDYDPADKPVLQNACLRSHMVDPSKFCNGTQGAKETFCYTFAGGPDSDSWALGKQHRTGLPDEPALHYSEEVVANVCEKACKEKVGGMEMLKEDAWEVLEGYYNLVGKTLNSSVVFYPSLPDMCEDCK